MIMPINTLIVSSIKINFSESNKYIIVTEYFQIGLNL